METKMKMPWSVRFALGWFVLLAIVGCVPAVWAAVEWWRDDVDSAEFGLAVCVSVGLVSIGLGFVRALLRGLREWVVTPYLLIGVFAFHLPLTGSDPHLSPLSLWTKLYLLGVVLVTIVPLVMLYLPASNRWFAVIPQRKKLGIGCCSLIVLAIMGVMASMVDVVPSDVVTVSEQRMGGLVLYQKLMSNEVKKTLGQKWVDASVCTNTVDLVERLSVLYGTAEEELPDRVSAEWSIAVNLPDDAPDTFPLMISANVDPSQLPREWDGETDKSKRFEPRPIEGVEPLSLGRRYVVIVRKGGEPQVIRRKYMTFGTIFGDKPYKLGEDTYFLTPVGKICPMSTVEKGQNP